MDYEEKKVWLRRGIDADKKIQRLSDEIEAERASYVSIKALQYDDMPHSSSGKITDLSDALTKIEHLFDKLRDELNRQYALSKTRSAQRLSGSRMNPKEAYCTTGTFAANHGNGSCRSCIMNRAGLTSSASGQSSICPYNGVQRSNTMWYMLNAEPARKTSNTIHYPKSNP